MSEESILPVNRPMNGFSGTLTQIAIASLITYLIVFKVLGLFPPVSFAALVGF